MGEPPLATLRPGERVVGARSAPKLKLSSVRVGFQILLHFVIVAHLIAWYRFDQRGVGGLDFQDFFHHFVARGEVTMAVVFAGIVWITALVFGRLFCSWGCHFAAVQDVAAWILRRVGWKFRPIETRFLHLAPYVVLVLVFLLPASGRWVVDGWRLEAPSTLAAFAGSAPWERLPGVVLSIITFAVCGGAILLFLGTRGFCRYVCPYGALFRVTDRVAPLRVRRTSACAPSCAQLPAPPCTRACPTAIDVHREVIAYGEVRAIDCVRCHLCIEACPSTALGLRFRTLPLRAGPAPRLPDAASGTALEGAARSDATPPTPIAVRDSASLGSQSVLRPETDSRSQVLSRASRPTFTLREEIAIAVLTAVAYSMVDLVYGGHFLAFTLALALAWLSVVAVRSRPRRRSTRRPAPTPTQIPTETPPEPRHRVVHFAVVAICVLAWMLVFEAGVYRFSLFRGRTALERALPELPSELRTRVLEGAARKLRVAIALFPDRPEGRELLVRAYVALGSPQALEEARDLRRVLGAGPEAEAFVRELLFEPVETPSQPSGGSPGGRAENDRPDLEP
jgi:ferredoxin